MERCRLCGGAVGERFRLMVRGRHEVGYGECGQCGSLQTERPYWLEEVYGGPNLDVDVGFLRRNLLTAALTAEVLRAAGIGEEDVCLDWGAGRGLFCRMMRDAGFNFHAWDRYADCEIVAAYRIERPEEIQPRAVTAFEVFEHFAEPAAELEGIMGLGAELVVFSTDVYEGQGADWWYLDPLTGQHVFFYSRAALEWIARRHGRKLVALGMAWAFVPEGSAVEEGPWLERGIDRLAAELKHDAWRGVGRDYQAMLARRTLTEQASGTPPDRPED
mgnify:CR=1 FL=1